MAGVLEEIKNVIPIRVSDILRHASVGLDSSGSWRQSIDRHLASNSVVADFDTNYTAQTPLTVGTAPIEDGAIIRILNLWITNKESAAVNVVLKDDTTQIGATLIVPANQTMILSDGECMGLQFATSLIVDPDGTFTNGIEINIGYYQDNGK